MIKPLVSVIVPHYRHGEFISDRIKSIYGQSFRDYEVICLDDDSPLEDQEKLKVLQKQYGFNLILNQQNSGNSFHQWQKGVAAANGKYLWIAESDDRAYPEFLDSLVNRLEINSQAGFAYCQSELMDERGRVSGTAESQLGEASFNKWWKHDMTLTGHDASRHFLFRNIVPNASAVLIRRQAYENVNGVDPRFKLCGDWDLWVRIVKKYDLEYCSIPLNQFRIHSATVRSLYQDTGVPVEETLRIQDYIEENFTVERAQLRQALGEQLWEWIRIRKLVKDRPLNRIITKRFQKLYRQAGRLFVLMWLRKSIGRSLWLFRQQFKRAA